MSDPIPLNYGEANWQDFNNNWRKKDGDFLQSRSILRYETTAARDAIASPPAGMTIYNAQTDRLEVRVASAGGSWNGLFSVDGLLIEKTGSDVKLRHTSTPASNGMVFSNNLITTQVPIATSGGELRFEASGLTVSTGTRNAVLTTDAADLISDTRIKAPSLWATGALTVGGASTLTGAVTAAGTLSVTGLLTANAQVSLTASPTAAGHATRKDYVDAQVATRVAKAGDTMTERLLIYGTTSDECLAIAHTANPYIGFHQTGVGRKAYIQATADWLVIGPENKYGVYFGTSNSHITTNYAVWGGMVVGRGTHGWPGLWVSGESDVAGYRFLSYGGDTYVNATAKVGIRINNQEQVAVTPTRCSMNGHFWASYNSPNADWQNSAFVAYALGGHYTRIAFHWPGFAPMVRGGATRESIDAVSWNQGAYCAHYASTHYNASALRFKKEVRALRPKRTLAVARHDPVSDEVVLPNIMALRPVVYRLANDPTRLTYDDEGKPDGGTVPEPWGTVWGRESRRERLGLIADEVQYVLPWAVAHDAEGDPEAIDYAQIAVALLDHVQQLTERVEMLEGTTSNGHVVGNGHKAAIAA